MHEPAKVLVVDDEPSLRRTLGRTLVQRGFDVTLCENGSAALAHLQTHDVDVMLVDMLMPGATGLDVLREVKTLQKGVGEGVEVVIMTAYSRIEDAVAAVRAGAYDFLTKPFASLDAVVLTISKATERRRLIARARSLEAELEQAPRQELIGQSLPMRKVYRLIDGVAASSSTVLVLGESGTGKELVARAIHRRSQRAGKPFVAVNCSAIPDSLIESELFGHVRGAFTSAVAAKTGLFELADKGTLFLDEIGDLSLTAQVKLLRALQEGEIKRVGSSDTKTVDVRVVAATNVDLREKLAQGQFREDLFYRLNVIAVSLPSLRERPEDIALLSQHFLRKFSRHIRAGKEPLHISNEAIDVLQRFDWPGNVRQLENAIERAVVLTSGSEIRVEDLPVELMGVERENPRNGARGLGAFLPPASGHTEPVATSQSPLATELGNFGDVSYAEAKRRMLLEFDRVFARHVLTRSGGNVSEAARLAGLDRSNFRRVLRKTPGAKDDD